MLRRHLVLDGGKEQVILTPASVQITNVSFGEEIADEGSRTVVKMSFESLGSGDEELDEEKADDEDEDEENGLKIATTVLCALTPGKVRPLHARCNLFLPIDILLLDRAGFCESCP